MNVQTHDDDDNDRVRAALATSLRVTLAPPFSLFLPLPIFGFPITFGMVTCEQKAIKKIRDTRRAMPCYATPVALYEQRMPT